MSLEIIPIQVLIWKIPGNIIFVILFYDSGRFFLNDVQWPVSYISTHTADVFANNANTYQLNSSNKKYSQH